jgi:hypothetical protein
MSFENNSSTSNNEWGSDGIAVSSYDEVIHI